MRFGPFDEPVLGRLRSALVSGFGLAVAGVVLLGCFVVLLGHHRESPAHSTSVRIASDGSLTADPRPLTLDDVNAQAPGSASEAVMRLWFWAQWGSIPDIVGTYLPAVVRTVGAEKIASVYASQRPAIVAELPKIKQVVAGHRGAIVAVDALRRSNPPRHLIFNMAKRGDRWYVGADTLVSQPAAVTSP